MKLIVKLFFVGLVIYPMTFFSSCTDETQDEVIDIAADLVQAAIDQCNDPMVHKMMMSLIIDNFLRWHTQAGMNEMENGNERSTVCWLRDAGKFQAIHNILDTISCGPNDWTTGQ